MLCKLKGLRNRVKEEGRGIGRGRKFNRKFSGFQYFKFTEYLTNKVALVGIKVIKVFKNWTSQTCRKCNQRGTRRTQGLFVCKNVVKRVLIEMLFLISLTGFGIHFQSRGNCEHTGAGSCSLLVFFSSLLMEYDQIPLCVKL